MDRGGDTYGLSDKKLRELEAQISGSGTAKTARA
jgi:hypothetical protein